MWPFHRILFRRGAEDQPIGARGERLAARYLRSRGYRIVGRNVRVGKDEIDLLAVDPKNERLVFVEVKTRRDDGTPPEEHVDRTKQHRQSRAAAHTMKKSEYAALQARFDVIAIVWRDADQPLITHYEHAYESTL